MTTRTLIFMALLLMLLPIAACSAQPNNNINTPSNPFPPEPPAKPDISINPTVKNVIMKGIGIDITQSDFIAMKEAGVSILTTEWGMEEDIDIVEAFLDRANAAGLKVVLDGGFSSTAWGFAGDDWGNLPRGKRPTWQRDKVQSWVRAFKDHPAVFAWDICNEYGENFPSDPFVKNSQWSKTAISLTQLKQARNDVLQIDPGKPILIRTYEWDLDEPPFGTDKPFDTGLADIVMLNLYSNYMENSKLQWPDVIQDVGARCVKIIKAKDPNARIWVSIAAFEDANVFQRPTATSLTRDIKETLKIPNVDGIAFFEWGPPIDNEKGWYLPEMGSDLWEVIKQSIPAIKAS